MSNSTKTVETLIGRARSAIEYITRVREDKYGIWFVLGMGKTKWEDESNPPYPSPTLIKVPDPIGYFKVDTIRLVYPDSKGGIYTPYGRYDYVPETLDLIEIAATRATHVYLSCSIDKEDLPTGLYYRMLGLCRSLELSYALTNKTERLGLTTKKLSPSQVLRYRLDWVATFPPRSTADIAGTAKLQIVRSY